MGMENTFFETTTEFIFMHEKYFVTCLESDKYLHQKGEIVLCT